MQKFNFTIIIIAMLFPLTVTSNAQYRLNIGNFWVYSTDYQEYRISVIDTATFFDSVFYFEVYQQVSSLLKSNSDNSSQYYIRKKNDNFYERLTINHNTNDTVVTDDVFYKYNAKLGDKWIYLIDYYEDSTVVDTSWSEVEDVFEGYLFGEWRIIKKIHYYSEHPQVPLDFNKYFCDDFGELSEENYIEVVSWLKGCYIDGVAYGDTSFIVVGVSDDSFLREFKLSQNYPNPFNPTTIINFVIPNEVRNQNDTRSTEYYSVLQNVTLKVYDVLGCEVATLVNEQKSAGSYEVKFDASQLSSGIYFYTLSAGSKNITKKMILLR